MRNIDLAINVYHLFQQTIKPQWFIATWEENKAFSKIDALTSPKNYWNYPKNMWQHFDNRETRTYKGNSRSPHHTTSDRFIGPTPNHMAPHGTPSDHTTQQNEIKHLNVLSRYLQILSDGEESAQSVLNKVPRSVPRRRHSTKRQCRPSPASSYLRRRWKELNNVSTLKGSQCTTTMMIMTLLLITITPWNLNTYRYVFYLSCYKLSAVVTLRYT